MTDLSTKALVAAAMQFLICLASQGMGFASCVAVRVKDGARRKGFRLVGSAFFIQALSAACAAAMAGLDSYFFNSGFFFLNRFFTSFYYISGWLGRIACATLLFVLVRAGSNKSGKVIYWCNLGYFALLVSLSTVTFGGLEGYLPRRPFDPVSGVSVNPPFMKLAGAVDILLFVGSTLALGLCAYRTLSSSERPRQQEPHQRYGAILILTAGSVFWIQTVWTLAESILMNNLLDRPQRGPAHRGVSRMDRHYVAQSVGFFYLNFAALVLLYVACRKSAAGLYTDPNCVRNENRAPSQTCGGRQRIGAEEVEEKEGFHNSPTTQQHPAELPSPATDEKPSELEQNPAIPTRQYHYRPYRPYSAAWDSNSTTPLAAAELPSPVIGNGSLRPWPLPAYHDIHRKEMKETKGQWGDDLLARQWDASNQQQQRRQRPEDPFAAGVHELPGSFSHHPSPLQSLPPTAVKEMLGADGRRDL